MVKYSRNYKIWKYYMNKSKKLFGSLLLCVILLVPCVTTYAMEVL